MLNKFLILCLIFGFVCTCQISCTQSVSDEATESTYGISDKFEGMDFKVYYSGDRKGGIYVVNMTKEKLQCQLLEKQIKEYGVEESK